MRTRIKICGITSAEDAALAEALGADALGFNFYPKSSRFVAPELAGSLVAGLSPFVTAVGLFVDKSHDEVSGILGAVKLDLLQFHGSESEDFCKSFGIRYIKAIRATSAQSITDGVRNYPSAAMLLFDTASASGFGGTGETFDWSMMPALERPYLLAGGLNPDNVGEAIRTLHPFSVDVSSGVEVEAGRKDAERMKAFFAAVSAADRAKASTTH